MIVHAGLTPFFADETEVGRRCHAVEIAELPANTVEQAKFLLDRLLVRVTRDGVVAGRIVETEAYPPGDPAAHHYRRMTPRNRSLFLERGRAYVYRAYGTSWMLNVSSEHEGLGAGVLIRAVAPETGTAIMALRRGNVPARDIARGPGRLAEAFAIDRSLDGIDLCRPGELYLARHEDDTLRAPPAIGVSVRIGITRAVDAKLRFFVLGSRFVSGPARLNAPAAAAPCHPDEPCPM